VLKNKKFNVDTMTKLQPSPPSIPKVNVFFHKNLNDFIVIE